MQTVMTESMPLFRHDALTTTSTRETFIQNMAGAASALLEERTFPGIQCILMSIAGKVTPKFLTLYCAIGLNGLTLSRKATHYYIVKDFDLLNKKFLD